MSSPPVPEALPAGDPGAGRNGSSRRIGTAVSWTVTLFLVALVVGIIFYGATRPQSEPPVAGKSLANVEVSTIRAETYREGLVLPAVLRADREAAVSPEFGGKLARWRVEEGERVSEGQVVAELDTADLRATRNELESRRRSAEKGVSQAEVRVSSAEVALENARKEAQIQRLALRAAEADRDLARTEYERAKHLVEERVLDQASLDTAENAFTQAEIRVTQAEEAIARAELAVASARSGIDEARAARAVAEASVEELGASIEALQVKLDKSKLRAPISGRLEEHRVEPGEVVAAGDPVARLYDLDHLRAVLSVPDRYVPFLDDDNPTVQEYIRRSRPGATQELRAAVEVPGLPRLTGGKHPGLSVPARIARVAQAASPESNTFEVELRLENPAGALRDGIIGQGRIEYLIYPRAIVIPMRAAQVTDAGPRVMVAETADGHTYARIRDIEPVSIQDDRLLVLAGLHEGERLIVAGWKGLVAGEEVNVVVEDGTVTTASRGEASPPADER